jgi:hypothetical protein
MVVGPSFNPVPDKLVTAIASGLYVDLAALVSPPSDESSLPTMSFDGRLIITPPPLSRKTKQITDVVHWAQAFSIFSLVLVTWFPHRARDLLLYELLILRTYSKFGRDAWRNYDEAFRRDAAARGLSDWSNMNVELFNIHTAAVRVPRSPSRVQHAGSSTPSSSFFLQVLEQWVVHCLWQAV